MCFLICKNSRQECLSIYVPGMPAAPVPRIEPAGSYLSCSDTINPGAYASGTVD